MLNPFVFTAVVSVPCSFQEKDPYITSVHQGGKVWRVSIQLLVLLATGEGKAKAIRDSIKGNIDPKVPASILRAHQNVQFFLDEGVASLL